MKFANWVEKFAYKHNLFNPGKTLLVAVSGGLDSIVLTDCLARIHQKNAIGRELGLLHINHQTRSKEEHKADLEVVIELADKYNLEFHFETVKTKTSQEHVLREARESIYKRYAARFNAQITTAHHLDDSFEWSLMQSFKTSNPHKTLGIPIKRTPVIRPFLCVSKDQIEKYASKEKLSYQEDKTNQDLSYERNFVRHEIIPKIKKRFPKYLKHYVNQKTELIQKTEKTLVEKVEDSIILKVEKDIESYKPEIRRVIHSLSKKKRGSIAGQLDKLVQAYRNSKKGPVSFSGGVQAHISKKVIVFNHSKAPR